MSNIHPTDGQPVGTAYSVVITTSRPPDVSRAESETSLGAPAETGQSSQKQWARWPLALMSIVAILGLTGWRVLKRHR